MAKVYNWQIGREMDYRFEGGKVNRQFAAVFNINRCIACQTCTMACKSTWTFSPGQELMWWNNVETKPYGGYPLQWDVKALDLQEKANPGGQVWDPKQKDAAKAPYGKFEGKTIFESADGVNQVVTGYLPAEDEWKTPNIYEDTATMYPKNGVTLPTHEGWFFYLQRICNHCTYPACLAACPRNAASARNALSDALVARSRSARSVRSVRSVRSGRSARSVRNRRAPRPRRDPKAPAPPVSYTHLTLPTNREV